MPVVMESKIASFHKLEISMQIEISLSSVWS